MFPGKFCPKLTLPDLFGLISVFSSNKAAVSWFARQYIAGRAISSGHGCREWLSVQVCSFTSML